MSPRPENAVNRNLFVGLHYRAISKGAPVGNNRRRAGPNGVEWMKAIWTHQMQQSREREERRINYIMDNNSKMVAAVMESIRSFQQSMEPPGGHSGQGYEEQDSYTTGLSLNVCWLCAIEVFTFSVQRFTFVIC